MGAEWTTPFFGVSHCGRLTDKRWATITDLGVAVALRCVLKGSIFDGSEFVFASEADAKAAAERWIARGLYPG